MSCLYDIKIVFSVNTKALFVTNTRYKDYMNSTPSKSIISTKINNVKYLKTSQISTHNDINLINFKKIKVIFDKMDINYNNLSHNDLSCENIEFNECNLMCDQFRSDSKKIQINNCYGCIGFKASKNLEELIIINDKHDNKKLTICMLNAHSTKLRKLTYAQKSTDIYHYLYLSNIIFNALNLKTLKISNKQLNNMCINYLYNLAKDYTFKKLETITKVINYNLLKKINELIELDVYNSNILIDNYMNDLIKQKYVIIYNFNDIEVRIIPDSFKYYIYIPKS